MWMCPHCKSLVQEDDWDTCWSCNRERDVKEPAYEATQKAIPTVQTGCLRCSGKMIYHGNRTLHHRLNDSFIKLDPESNCQTGFESVILYYCEQCGRIEWFMSDIGTEFRNDP